MEQVINGCEGCLNFMDDIIIFGESEEQHDKRLENTLKRLKSYYVTLNEDKCVYGVKEIVFLGHKLSEKGMRPTDDKLIAIKQFREPKTAEETRSFLGLVNYMGKFIPNLATVTEPLRQLTKKDAGFIWEFEQRKAFNALKNCLSKESTLGY